MLNDWFPIDLLPPTIYSSREKKIFSTPCHDVCHLLTSKWIYISNHLNGRLCGDPGGRIWNWIVSSSRVRKRVSYIMTHILHYDLTSSFDDLLSPMDMKKPPTWLRYFSSSSKIAVSDLRAVSCHKRRIESARLWGCASDHGGRWSEFF